MFQLESPIKGGASVEDVKIILDWSHQVLIAFASFFALPTFSEASEILNAYK